MSKSKTLKELLECEFTVNENGEMVGEIPLERINEIAYILTNQKERIDKAIEYIKDRFDEDKGIWIIDCYDLLEILGDKENE